MAGRLNQSLTVRHLQIVSTTQVAEGSMRTAPEGRQNVARGAARPPQADKRNPWEPPPIETFAPAGATETINTFSAWAFLQEADSLN